MEPRNLSPIYLRFTFSMPLEYPFAQRFLSLRHTHLCEYVAAEVGTGERVYLVSEHHQDSAACHVEAQNNILG
jgi:hypothetical protein